MFYIVTQGIYFNDSEIVNHGIVTLDRIKNTAPTAVVCVTPATDCCTSPPQAVGWYGPDSAKVALSSSSDVYYTRGDSFVDLRRNGGGMEGLYRCDIPLMTGDLVLSSFYVAIYQDGNGNEILIGCDVWHLLL